MVGKKKKQKKTTIQPLASSGVERSASLEIRLSIQRLLSITQYITLNPAIASNKKSIA